MERVHGTALIVGVSIVFAGCGQSGTDASNDGGSAVDEADASTGPGDLSKDSAGIPSRDGPESATAISVVEPGDAAASLVEAGDAGDSDAEAAASPAVLYASPAGTGATCSAAQPCSIAQAQTTVRALAPSQATDITIELADGVYRLLAPMTFTAADSGGNGHRITWQAASGAHPVLSGGQKVTGWTLHDPAKNIWQAAVGAGPDARQLYVDSRIATRARATLNRADLTANAAGYAFTSAALVYLNNLTGQSRIDIESVGSFTDRYSPVLHIVGNAIAMVQPSWSNNTWGYDTIIAPFRTGPLYLENAYELLGQPGEWYLDLVTGTLSYVPLAGQNMATVDVELPRVQSLLLLTGTYDHPIHDLTFRGLQFSHTSWLGPTSAEGYADQQTGAFVTGSGYPVFEATRPVWHQMPAAVQISAAKNITFIGNRFANLGQVALGIGNDANAHESAVGLGIDSVAVTGNVFVQDSGEASWSAASRPTHTILAMCA